MRRCFCCQLGSDQNSVGLGEIDAHVEKPTFSSNLEVTQKAEIAAEAQAGTRHENRNVGCLGFSPHLSGLQTFATSTRASNLCQERGPGS